MKEISWDLPLKSMGILYLTSVGTNMSLNNLSKFHLKTQNLPNFTYIPNSSDGEILVLAALSHHALCCIWLNYNFGLRFSYPLGTLNIIKLSTAHNFAYSSK